MSASIVPTKWKLSQLYPIPKPSDWNYDFNNTRPILLLETLRKIVTKVITTRLSNVCSQHNILQGPNFAGLKGESTSEPIHTLNNIMEDTRKRNKELWIAL